jgi:predicted transcriptional regulator
MTRKAQRRREKKLQPLSIRLDADVRRCIEKLARKDDRSLSAYINRVLRDHSIAKGCLTE